MAGKFVGLDMQVKKIDGHDNEQSTHDTITPLQVAAVAHRLADPGAAPATKGRDGKKP
jgi:hypothetical protein